MIEHVQPARACNYAYLQKTLEIVCHEERARRGSANTWVGMCSTAYLRSRGRTGDGRAGAGTASDTGLADSGECYAANGCTNGERGSQHIARANTRPACYLLRNLQ